MTAITTADFASHGDKFVVQAWDADGREYILLTLEMHVRLMTSDVARRVASRVRVAGKIDLNLWSCRAPYGSRAWLLDGEEDRLIEDERFGYY